MKNMVNQLHASHEKRAKSFTLGAGQPNFGWKQIEDMWEREKRRRDMGHVRMVPGLLQSYIERDSWTKLNVRPAKIMQVCISFLCTLFSLSMHVNFS